MVLLDDMAIPTLIIGINFAVVGTLLVWLVTSINKRLATEEKWRADFLIQYNKDKADAVEKDNQVALKILKEMEEIKLGANALANEIKYRAKP